MEKINFPRLDNFEAHGDEERQVYVVLKQLVALQHFDVEKGKLFGPRISVAEVARRAAVPRNAVGQDGCRLQRSRDLILHVVETLKDFSLQYECDYLRAENNRLKARIDYMDSENADSVVLQCKEQAAGERATGGRWTGGQVRAAAKVISLRRPK